MSQSQQDSKTRTDLFSQSCTYISKPQSHSAGRAPPAEVTTSHKFSPLIGCARLKSGHVHLYEYGSAASILNLDSNSSKQGYKTLELTSLFLSLGMVISLHRTGAANSVQLYAINYLGNWMVTY